MAFSKHDISRNEFQLFRGQARRGYDWWWHSFTAIEEETGKPKPFFIEFFLCNPSLGEKEPTLGQSEEAKKAGKKPSYLMVNVGTWGEDARQLHRFFAWKDVAIHAKAPFSVSADDCYLDERSTRGHVLVTKEQADRPEYLCQGGEMSWNLKIKKLIPFNVGYGAGKLFRFLQVFEMFWHAEGMKSTFEGEIAYNGKKYRVIPETSFGYSDKNWGKDFTSPWVWLSSSDIKSHKTGQRLNCTVFDIGGGCPKVGPIALKRKLLSAVYYEGRCYEFNFSKFWTFCRTKFDCKETDTQIIWHVEQRTWRNTMIADFTCEKKDMLLIQYEAPNGTKKHNRLWNGGNGKGTLALYRDGNWIDTLEVSSLGCEYGEYCPPA